MKKIFLFILSIYLFASCTPDADVPEARLTNYSNSFYGFALEFPEEYYYCLNEMCYNEIPENAATTFTLSNASGYGVMNVQFYINSLGISAVNYGKRSLELNRSKSTILQDAYSDEAETQFAGVDAYIFAATGGFEERGGSISTDESGYMALVDDFAYYDSPSENLSFNGTFKVIYADHGSYFYRILYQDTLEIEGIMSSFRFL